MENNLDLILEGIICQDCEVDLQDGQVGYPRSCGKCIGPLVPIEDIDSFVDRIDHHMNEQGGVRGSMFLSGPTTWYTDDQKLAGIIALEVFPEK